MVYIGESDNVFNRLLQHAKDEKKDFWRLAAVVTSKDENLTKSHSRYLESRLISLTLSAKRATLLNTNSPPLPPLPEADIADMEYFPEPSPLGFACPGLQVCRTSRPEPD